MVFPIALALMGAGIYRKVRQDQQAEADAEEERQAKREERDFQRSERQRATGMRDALGQAAAPVTATPNVVRPEPIGVRDVATPADQLGQHGFNVGSQTFPDMASAQAAAQAANDPRAQTMRMADVYARFGDPVNAQRLRTGARQEELAGLQLDEAHRKVLNQKYDDDLNAKVGSFDDLATFLSQSKGDGMGGAVQMQAQASPDGKKIALYRTLPDGSLQPTPLVFDNTPAGLQRAKATLSRNMTPGDKLTHLHQQAMEEQAASQLAATERHQQATEDIARQQLSSTDRHQRAMEGIASNRTAAGIEMAQIRADAAAERRNASGSAAVPRMDEIDKVTLGNLNKQRDQIAGEIVKAQAGGMWDEASANAKALRTQLAALDLKANQIVGKYQQGQPADPLDMRGKAKDTKPPTPIAGGEPAAEEPSVLGFMGNLISSAAAAPKKKSAASPAPAAAPAPAAPAKTYSAKESAVLDARQQAEEAEMNAGNRMQYSPEVKDYVAAKRAKADIAAQAESDAYRQREFQRAQRAR